MSDKKKALATLQFSFHKDGNVETNIDFDEAQMKYINRETILAIQMAKTSQGLVIDLMNGGTVGSLIASAVKSGFDRLEQDDDE